MKCYDLLNYKIMQTMYRAEVKSLPDCVQSLFLTHDGKYDLRVVCKFSVQKAKKGIKRRRVSIVGVQLWNNVKMDVRMVDWFWFSKGLFIKKCKGYKCDCNVCIWIYIHICIYGYIYILFLFFFILY